jgi:hypothetical protein
VYYGLQGKITYPIKTQEELNEIYRKKSVSNRVDIDVFNGTKISTVFLEINHRWDRIHGQPILFETMIFGGKYDGTQERYCTYEQAEFGHKEWVKKIIEEEHVSKWERVLNYICKLMIRK